MRLRPSLLPLVFAAVSTALATYGCGPRLDAAGLDLLQVRPQAQDPARISAHLVGPAAGALKKRLGDSASALDAEPYFFVALKERQDAPLVARLQVSGDEVQFEPQAPLTPGKEYVAVFRGSRLGAGLPDLSRSYRLPEVEGSSPARVLDSYPRVAELPANVFRFYLWFSEPMAEGHLFKHARLLDETGQPVPRAFHEVELWAEDHRRLTIWLSPGRTKQGLTLSEHSGAVMMPDTRYTLEIAAGLPDQRGRPLAQPFRYSFRTTAADHQQPAISAWQVETPRAGTLEPLRVTFPEPLDRPLIDELISVELAGTRVGGKGAAADDGRSWKLTPSEPWQAAEYSLVAGGELDDLAGNSLYRAFETSGAGSRPAAKAPDFRIPFQPHP